MCCAGDPDLLFVNVQEAEEAESPKHSIRDSGYIDCWDSERSDSLSPPRHGREDSFDSLDSLGSRSRQTPSPDVPVTRGSSDGKRRLFGFQRASRSCVLYNSRKLYLGRNVR